jgi:hypothetical protein
MALPTRYTASTLAAYMHRQLGDVAVDLGWTVATDEVGSYADVVDEVALGSGVTDVADVADIRRLRLLARQEAWRAAMQATAGDTDWVGDDQAEKAAQRHAQAKAQLALAQAELQRYDAQTTAQARGADSAVSASVPTQAVW